MKPLTLLHFIWSALLIVVAFNNFYAGLGMGLVLALAAVYFILGVFLFIGSCIALQISLSLNMLISLYTGALFVLMLFSLSSSSAAPEDRATPFECFWYLITVVMPPLILLFAGFFQVTKNKYLA